MHNFLIRTLTGIVYVALLVTCTVFGPVPSFFFYSIIAVLCTLEFCLVLNRETMSSLQTPLVSLATLLLVSTSWLFCIGSASVARMAALYGLLLIYIFVSELYRAKEIPIRDWALVAMSQLYVALPMSLLPFLSITTNAEGELVYSWMLPLSLFIFIWVNDTGAYISGMLLHNYFPAKLFPRISPKKSWVGSIGGGVFTLLASVAAYKFFPETMSLWQWSGLALVVVVFGTWGDLIESLLKRTLSIKDSSHILPGHGGFLDRFDSALLAIPAAAIYLTFVS